jgi:hypothetical protein
MSPNRLLVAPALLLLASLLGCSGGSGGSNTVNESDDGWTGRTNIEATFASYCSGCHGTTWSSCWTVQANAGSVQSEVSSGDMPRGSTMAPSDKTALLEWLQQGAPCSGTEPNGQDSGVVVVGGGAPIVAGEVR